jgi:hypothetical protein
MDYEIPHCTRHCSVTGREFTPGEKFYSAVVAEGAELVRRDFARDAWTGPPEKCVGWWKSQMPGADARRMHWAPNDVMLQLFEQLEGEPEKQAMRYLLALLLVRRRVMRLDETERDGQGRETLVLYCPRRDATYRTPVVVPDEAGINQIQEELARLLVAGGR